jgi:hypothetical protein
MTALTVTAVTNFILACEVFLFAGLTLAREKAPRSALWFWGLAILLLGVSALLGGIDHGFLEPFGQTPNRIVLERSNWLVLGVMTAMLLLTTAAQFFSARLQRWAAYFAVVQFLVYAALVIYVGDFLVVIANYAPVMLLLLVLSVIGLKDGRGSWPMVIGIVILFVASGVQASGFDALTPVDHNGLYHLMAMAGVVFLYAGGLKLRAVRANDRF